MNDESVLVIYWRVELVVVAVDVDVDVENIVVAAMVRARI